MIGKTPGFQNDRHLENPPKSKDLIVEIGPNLNPIPELSQKILERIEAGSPYIAIGCDEEEIIPSARNKAFPGPAVVGDLVDLPLQDGVAGEIWLINVFGRLELAPNVNIDKCFQELARVTKAGGKVIIGEFSPRSGALDEFEYRDLITNDYHKFGFEKTVFQGQNFQNFWRQNQIPMSVLETVKPENPFFLVLAKKN